MTTTTLTAPGDYEPAYRERVAATPALSQLREHAFERFAAVGMPTARKGNERWKYTNIAPIARSRFQVLNGATPAPVDDALTARLPSGPDWTTLAFVDGVYSPSHSTEVPKGVTISLLSGDEANAANLLGTVAPVDSDDGFGALNTALFTGGALVRIEGEHDDDSPVHLIFISTAQSSPTMTSPRVFIEAARHSKSVVIESHIGAREGAQFSNAVTEVTVAEGAGLKHYRILDKGHDSYHVGTTRVRQLADSRYKAISFAFGSRIGRDDLHALLDGPGAECVLNGLYMTAAEDHLDNHISLTHAKPRATSRQLYKGILTDKSRAVFSGQVLVEKDAQKTYAEQRDMNLLLSDAAEVDTKPSLLIYADDVQCFHGAAAGEADEEAVFYMMSRGLDRATASRILISAFADEIVRQVDTVALRDHLGSTVRDLLPVFHF